jgi:hypothetical protein
MLSKPVNGEVIVKIGDFESKANYLTDIPNDCLDAFIFALDKGMPAVVYFQYNGYCFYVLADEYNTYVIQEENGKMFYHTEIDVIELAKQLIADIESCMDDWAMWKYYMGELDWDAEEERINLEEKLAELRYLLNKRFKSGR